MDSAGKTKFMLTAVKYMQILTEEALTVLKE